MEANLEHEDLLIKLRAKLNEQEIKLWEPPFVSSDEAISASLLELAEKYAAILSLDKEIILNGLHELQQHSIDKTKAIAEFKETGLATFKVKITLSGEKPKVLSVQKMLSVMGSDLIETVAKEADVTSSRVKLIYNGKVIKPTPSLGEQGLKNGVQVMALIMAVSQEQVAKEDKLYKEVRSTLDDATLLTEQADCLIDDDYMNLEDQSGKAIDLPPNERRSLMIGLALHERGRTAAKQHDYPLALVLFLEADRQFNECSSSILSSVDNWAVLQLDIAWCYLCLRSLPSAADAAARLARAEKAFKASYGEDHERLIALKGTAANERVLLMRLYLLQGIVAYHQNNRAEARRLLDKAENELNSLKVDESAVTALLELGWSHAAARAGLRAAAGNPDRAHHYLADRRRQRDEAREQHRQERQRRILGSCMDGSAVSESLLKALTGMGFARSLSILALRHSNNHLADAVRIIHEQPELLIESDEEPETPSNEDLPSEVDSKMLADLEAMGYSTEDGQMALRFARNQLSEALDMLAAAANQLQNPSDPTDQADPTDAVDSSNPSTSQGVAPRKKLRKYLKKQFIKHRERKAALKRLSAGIHADEDNHLDTSLDDEEQFLAQYKSLL